MLVRKPDWPARLDSFFGSRLARPFAYGENDCCLFVADAIEAMIGRDLAAAFRGRYASRKEAIDLARETTGRASVRAIAALALGELPAVPVLCAQRGDVLAVRRGRDVSLGILALNGKEIFGVAERGFLRLPLSLACAAWRV